MPVSDKFIYKEVAGDYMLIPLINNNMDMSKIFNINEVGAFIYKQLKNTDNLELIANNLIKEYDIDYETALKDVKEFVNELKKREIYE